jgi:hypothetical protein
MKERAKGFEKIAATGDAQQLPPGTATGMAIGTEIAPADPASIGTVRVRAKVHRGVNLAAAPPRGHHAGWWECGRLWARVAAVLTGVAVWLGGEACKGGGFAAALWRWGWERGYRWARNGGGAWPYPVEHDTQPQQGNQHHQPYSKKPPASDGGFRVYVRGVV